MPSTPNIEDGYLNLPRSKPLRAVGSSGLHQLEQINGGEAFLYVPKATSFDRPADLVVFLHGAGGNGSGSMIFARPLADMFNFIVLCPSSQRGTWDAIGSRRFNSDVEAIRGVLTQVFSEYNIDPAHVCLSGFSDGATYALCLGLSNGDLFTHVLALSPGFYYTRKRVGKPRIFIAHGRNDKVLPIDRCSRRIVPQLMNEGYDVVYKEFLDGHILMPNVVHDGIQWFEQ